MQQKEHDIKQLFREISAGNRYAFDALFRLYYTNLVHFAKNYVSDTGHAEEVVSDVFVRLWFNRETLASISNPQVYLFISVKNRCLKVLRGTSHIVSMEEYKEKSTETAENPLSEMERKELSAKLHAIINALPEQQRLVFNMIKQNSLTAKQAAEILQLSPRTVETHLYKAVKQLEQEITDYLGYSPKKKGMKRMIMLAL
ncbi:MAG: RNA polymerase sigma-70 factor [Petrimonas sp.]|nr:RNA polymerase sigma-70 factor [Petrimonas sp.]